MTARRPTPANTTFQEFLKCMEKKMQVLSKVVWSYR